MRMNPSSGYLFGLAQLVGHNARPVQDDQIQDRKHGADDEWIHNVPRESTRNGAILPRPPTIRPAGTAHYPPNGVGRADICPRRRRAGAIWDGEIIAPGASRQYAGDSTTARSKE